jgi:hypothetical protein
MKPGVVYARRAMAGDMRHGPTWYTSMEGIQSKPTGARLPRNELAMGDMAEYGLTRPIMPTSPPPTKFMGSARPIRYVSSRTRNTLGSLGDDPIPATTLDTPTVTDPTQQWQDQVLSQLQSGVAVLKAGELQKWLQIAATLSIPLAAAVWRAILGRRRSKMDVSSE